jgi:hypothetical protein
LVLSSECIDTFVMAKKDTGTELTNPNTQSSLSSNDSTEENNLITDEALLGIYGEVVENLRNDRKQLDEFIDNLAEGVINGGDSATSSKEALVNFVKIKVDTADKIAKIADLMTRFKMKQPDTYKPYLNKKGEGHTINIYDQAGVNKRTFLDSLKKEDKNGK